MGSRNKSIIFSILTFTSFCSFAQLNCPKPLSNLNVNISVDQIKYDYSKTSNEIRYLKGEKNKNLLGLYSTEKEISIRPNLSGVRLGNTSCASVTDLDVNILIKPTIFIAKEAQYFQCTKVRTEQHEGRHHQFEMGAIQKSKSNIVQLSQNIFGNQIMNGTKESYNNLIQYRTKELMNQILYFFKNETEHLHKSIDTEENYEAESSYCSREENINLSRMLSSSR